MAEPFLGEIKIWSCDYAPKGWATCDGQLLPINQNQALFSLLGVFYGGNGTTTFALPDLRGRVPLHVNNGQNPGQRGGEELHTLTINEIPQHAHTPLGANTSGVPSAAGATWAPQAANPYGTVPNIGMNPSAIGTAGGGQGHENRSPYLALNFCIALTGIYPSRN